MRWRSLAVLSSTAVSSTASADISMMRFIATGFHHGQEADPPELHPSSFRLHPS
jgi:hypothetical protein